MIIEPERLADSIVIELLSVAIFYEIITTGNILIDRNPRLSYSHSVLIQFSSGCNTLAESRRARTAAQALARGWLLTHEVRFRR